MNSWQTLETTMRLDRRLRLARAAEVGGVAKAEGRSSHLLWKRLRTLWPTPARAGGTPAASRCDECCAVGTAAAG